MWTNKNCDRIISDAHKTVRQKTKNDLFWFSHPYVNKRNRLMLGEGKKRRRRKTVHKQQGGFIGSIVSALAPTAIDLVTKLIR